MHFIYWYKKAATYSIWNLVSQNNVIQMSTKPEPDSHKRKICIRCDNNRIAFGPPINNGKRDIWQSPIPITKKMAIWQNTTFYYQPSTIVIYKIGNTINKFTIISTIYTGNFKINGIDCCRITLLHCWLWIHTHYMCDFFAGY